MSRRCARNGLGPWVLDTLLGATLVLMLLFALGCAGSAGSAGGDGAGSSPADTLHQQFPAHAAQVLGRAADGAPITTRTGFRLGAHGPRGTWQRVRAELPREGHGALRLVTQGGFSVSVRETGLTG